MFKTQTVQEDFNYLIDESLSTRVEKLKTIVIQASKLSDRKIDAVLELKHVINSKK